jgi:hypothetical protein
VIVVVVVVVVVVVGVVVGVDPVLMFIVLRMRMMVVIP